MNKEKRTLIITDIHGCYDECRALLEKMSFDEETDTLINLGDTIDRGPMIYETFLYLRGLKERMGERCILIRGNHEQMMLDAVENGGRDKDLWYYNSGEKTVYAMKETDYTAPVSDFSVFALPDGTLPAVFQEESGG